LFDLGISADGISQNPRTVRWVFFECGCRISLDDVHDGFRGEHLERREVRVCSMEHLTALTALVPCKIVKHYVFWTKATPRPPAIAFDLGIRAVESRWCWELGTVVLQFKCGCALHGNWECPPNPADVFHGWRSCCPEHCALLDQGADAYREETSTKGVPCEE
jgi:hypothetical protein